MRVHRVGVRAARGRVEGRHVGFARGAARAVQRAAVDVADFLTPLDVARRRASRA